MHLANSVPVLSSYGHQLEKYSPVSRMSIYNKQKASFSEIKKKNKMQVQDNSIHKTISILISQYQRQKQHKIVYFFKSKKLSLLTFWYHERTNIWHRWPNQEMQFTYVFLIDHL